MRSNLISFREQVDERRFGLSPGLRCLPEEDHPTERCHRLLHLSGVERNATDRYI